MAHQPQQLVAAAISTTEITLSWADVDTLEGETYDIERDSVVVEEGYAGDHSVLLPYTDTGLDPDTEYTYRVRAAGGTVATEVTPPTVAATATAPTPTVTIINPNADVTPTTVVTASTVLTPVITATTFSPSEISGLVAWYDFSSAATLFTDTALTTSVASDGDLIGSVNDKSTANRDLVRGGIAGTEPTYKVGIQNGLSVARFDGTADYLTAAAFTQAQPFSLIAVVKRTSTSTIDTFVNGSNTSFEGSTGVDTQVRLFSGTNLSTGTLVTTWGIAVGIGNGVSSRVWWNGGSGGAATAGTGNLTTAAPLGIGATRVGSSFHVGDIAEVLIYNSALSVADVNLLGNHLGTKWGITWTTAT